jgi:hypothetical protein
MQTLRIQVDLHTRKEKHSSRRVIQIPILGPSIDYAEPVPLLTKTEGKSVRNDRPVHLTKSEGEALVASLAGASLTEQPRRSGRERQKTTIHKPPDFRIKKKETLVVNNDQGYKEIEDGSKDDVRMSDTEGEGRE